MLDRTANLYLIGKFSGIVDFDPGIGVTELNDDDGRNFICKYDSTGNLLWVKQIDASLVDIETDLFGNLYMAGGFWGSVDFDLDTGTTIIADYPGRFVSKYNSAGGLIWVKTVEGSFNALGPALAVDSMQNVYMTGSFFDTIDIDPGPDVHLLTATQPLQVGFDGSDMYVCKFDSAGNLLWANDIGGNGDDAGSFIEVDNAGNIYISGYFNDTVNFDTSGSGYEITTDYWGVFMAKFDTSGTLTWVRSYAPNRMNFEVPIAVDNEGNLFATGTFRDSISFGVGAGIPDVTSYGEEDAFIIGLNENGDYIFSESLGSSGTDMGTGITVNGNGDLYISGSFSDTLFHNTLNSYPEPVSNGFRDFFVAKYSPPRSDSVFPGDANYNQVANNIDFLQIGLHYGQAKWARANASINWIGQPMSNWGIAQANGYDIKHVDCNGDSIINTLDVVPILLNYGFTHSSFKMRGGSTFNLELALPDSATEGQVITSSVTLGTPDTPMTNMYGIAFSLTYDTNFIVPGSVEMFFDTCWIGTEGIDMMAMFIEHPDRGQVDVAITRIDQQMVDGHGQIASFTYVMNDDIIGKREFSTTLNFDGIYAIDKFENVLDVGGIPAEMSVFTGINEDVFVPGIVIYPNPARDFIYVVSPNVGIGKVALMDVAGRTLLEVRPEYNQRQLFLNISDFAPGIYFVSLEHGDGVIAKKVMFSR